MVNKVLYLYKVCNIKKRFYNFTHCVSLEKRDLEFISVLKQPMLIHVSEKINKIDEKSPVLKTPLQMINNSDINLGVDFTPKFEKKNRSFSRSENNIDEKKNKIKVKKKTRSQMILDNDEIFIEDSKLVSSSNESSVNISLSKLSKQKKQKKKIKLRTSLSQTKSDNLKSDMEYLQISNINNKNSNIKKNEIVLDHPLTIQQLAKKLNVPEAAIITWLFLKGISVTINQVVDISIASQVANHYNFTILDSFKDQLISRDINNTKINVENGQKRAPVITIFGHVDHGKTTLLDSIRNTNNVSNEIGGITQSIAGYEVEHQYLSLKEKLVFLDTPGHQAFAAMRLRGAQVSDIAILLVAIDDGLKPQTIEVIDYIKSHKIPYIVAINKIDKLDSKTAKVREQLTTYNIVDKDWGGDSLIVEVSALTGENIDLLLNAICQLSNKLVLKSDESSLAQGMVLESYLDKQTGPIANIVIKNGTLKIGDTIVSGNISGRIKAIKDSSNSKIHLSKASSVVSISGFPSVPKAGLNFQVVQSEKDAKCLIDTYINNNNIYKASRVLNKRITLDSCRSESSIKQFNLLFKANTQGSIEAIIHSLSQIPQDKVQINILSATSGCVSRKDVDLAIASKSLIIGFNVPFPSNLCKIATKLDVEMKNFSVIYDLLDYLKDYMLDLIDIKYNKVEIGEAMIQTVFHINKGTVAGCIVKKGKLKKDAHLMVYRNQKLVHVGVLDSLKQIKDDIDEVLEGSECGVMCNSYHDFAKFDIIKVYEMVEAEKSL